MTQVLVIDDEAVVRGLMQAILREAGYSVQTAATAREAAAHLATSELDLVVSDIVMPDLSGLELLEAVRFRELELGRGAQWDPAIVDVALEMIDSGELSFAPDGLRVDFRAPVRPVREATVFEFPLRRNGLESTEAAG
jgi:DNA-binding NtrC family response regulator